MTDDPNPTAEVDLRGKSVAWYARVTIAGDKPSRWLALGDSGVFALADLTEQQRALIAQDAGIWVELTAGATYDAIDQAIEVLNRIHQADPTVLPTLIAHRVPCNETVRDDPTVQVDCRDPHGHRDQTSLGPCYVGILGIIENLYGIHPDTGYGHIVAIRTRDGRLTHFERTDHAKIALEQRRQHAAADQTTIQPTNVEDPT